MSHGLVARELHLQHQWCDLLVAEKHLISQSSKDFPLLSMLWNLVFEHVPVNSK